MSYTGFLASLNLGTLVIVFVVAATALIFFLQRRGNRHPMDGREHRNVAVDIDAGRAAPAASPRP